MKPKAGDTVAIFRTRKLWDRAPPDPAPRKATLKLARFYGKTFVAVTLEPELRFTVTFNEGRGEWAGFREGDRETDWLNHKIVPWVEEEHADYEAVRRDREELQRLFATTSQFDVSKWSVADVRAVLAAWPKEVK